MQTDLFQYARSIMAILITFTGANGALSVD